MHHTSDKSQLGWNPAHQMEEEEEEKQEQEQEQEFVGLIYLLVLIQARVLESFSCSSSHDKGFITLMYSWLPTVSLNNDFSQMMDWLLLFTCISRVLFV